jgi:hypothetical protein
MEAQSKRQTEFPTIDPYWVSSAIKSKNLFGGSSGLKVGQWLCYDMVLCQSFTFNMKRAAAYANSEKLLKVSMETFDILTKPMDPHPFSHAGVHYSIEDAKLECERTAIELARGLKWQDISDFVHVSKNASFSRSRQDGGPRGLVPNLLPNQQDLIESLKGKLPFPSYPYCTSSSDVRNQSPTREGHWTKRMLIDNSVLCIDESVHLLLRTLGLHPPEEEQTDAHQLTHWWDDWIMHWQSRDMLINLPIDLNGSPLAKIITLAEPLKERPITAGSETEYYWMLNLQRKIHGHLRKHPVLHLIGGAERFTDCRVQVGRVFSSPINHWDVMNMFPDPLPKDWFYVSGDYKGATNNISSDLSECTARAFMDAIGAPDLIKEMYVRTLTRHTIYDRSPFAPDVRVGQQANGQLMGSPSSFPILCMINLALSRWSQVLAGNVLPTCPLSGLRMLINGDDIVFPSSQEGYEVWKKTTACGGLFPSIGKNYTSPDFLVMNSVLFRRKGIEACKPMRSSGSRYCQNPLTWVNRKQDPYIPAMFGGVSDFPVPAHFSARSTWWAKKYDRDTQPYTPRVRFENHHWYNMDYLGPLGYFHALREKEEWFKVKKRQEDLEHHQRSQKMSRYSNRLSSYKDLLKPEFYQLLPGLQRSWLGDRRNSERHMMNCLFLQSWEAVLKDICNNSLDEIHEKGMYRMAVRGNTGLRHHVTVARRCPWKGHTPYSIAWFLPTQLGGMGLEDTGSGVSNYSLASRQLARYLLVNPQLNMQALPSLGEAPRFALEVSSRFSRLESQMRKQGNVYDCLPRHAPPGCIEHSQLLTKITTEVIFSSWGNPYWGPSKKEPGKHGDYGIERDEQVSLALSMENSLRNRRTFWSKKHKDIWKTYRPITQKMLDRFEPLKRYYRVVTPSPLKVSFNAAPLPGPPRYFDPHKYSYADREESGRMLPTGRIFPQYEFADKSFCLSRSSLVTVGQTYADKFNELTQKIQSGTYLFPESSGDVEPVTEIAGQPLENQRGIVPRHRQLSVGEDILGDSEFDRLYCLCDEEGPSPEIGAVRNLQTPDAPRVVWCDQQLQWITPLTD